MQRVQRNITKLLATSALALLAACAHEAGQNVDEGNFGTPTMINELAMTGQATAALQQRFASEVPSSITFAFDQATLTPEAMAILNRQADWIGQFPEIRFRVYGHTDMVGSNAYNYNLGLRRANAVVSYFAALGISRSRLEAVVSFGETQPVVFTQEPEQKNRRTVTEVTGFVKGMPSPLNGKYAEVVFREYVEGATRIHPSNTVVATEVAPSE